MKIRDLLSMEIDVDVYDDVCEELAIAFCGPVELTEEGLDYFSDVLDYEIEFCNDVVIVHVDHPEERVWKRRLRGACSLFNSMAGWCSASNYDRWFK